MPLLENSQHEAFAQARFSGKSLVEAHYAAGYAGDKASASRLNRLHEVQERIAELYREAAAQTAYEKTNAVRDLLAIIHTPPSNAHDDNPLCEVRMGKDGPYHRLPPKLQAMSRLIKLMAWDEPVKVEVELKDNFRDMLAEIRRRPQSPLSCSSEPIPVAGLFEPGFSGPEPDANPDSSSIEHPASCIESPSSTIANDRHPSPATANSPLPPRQEAFAISRVRGLGVMAAYHAAGYTGDTPNLAWRLNSMPAVKARIAELNGGVETATGYRKDDAVRDLVTIIHALPSQAGQDHPLCEMRMSSWGQYHRFPSKLAAITLLAKILGWAESAQVQVDHDPDAGFKQLAEFIRPEVVEQPSGARQPERSGDSPGNPASWSGQTETKAARRGRAGARINFSSRRLVQRV